MAEMRMRRQAVLAAGSGLVSTWSGGLTAMLGGCSTLPPASARAPVRPREVADGVYLLQGLPGAADEANLGRIGNAGFIVGDAGVIAVDTGTSRLHGEAILAAIASVTRQPVKLALVSHTRPEFLFGGSAFQARGIPVQMHDRCARLMTARCENCLRALRQSVGEAPLAGTAMYRPDAVFEASQTLNLIGRPVRIEHFGHSSGPGDIAVLDERSGTLFAGGLLDAGHVPDIQDSDLPGWHRALAALRRLQPRTVVPGHGPADGPALIDTVERYLRQLETKVRQLVLQGSSLLTVSEDGDLPEYQAWDQYDLIHRRNASIAYLRIERELILK